MSEENIRVVQSFFDAFLAGKPSRAEPLVDSQFEDRLAQVYTLRAGRIRRINAFQTLAEALEAAGVSE